MRVRCTEFDIRDNYVDTIAPGGSVVLIDEPCPRILLLDGGGFRGMILLYIIREIMSQITGKDNSMALPCDYFDLICGSGTGGLIAILLGRLQLVLFLRSNI